MASRWTVLAVILALSLSGCTEDPSDEPSEDDPSDEPASSVDEASSDDEGDKSDPDPSPSPTPSPSTSPSPTPPVAAPPPTPTGPPTILVTGDGPARTFVLDWTATPSHITWWFGDGAQSTEQSPTHAYSTDDTYTVRVEARHSGQTWEATTPVTIDGVPLQIHTVAAGATATFSFSWGKTASSILWDFGDGTTSTAPEASHTYATGGPFTVSVTVQGGGASATETIDLVLDEFPVAITAQADRTIVEFSATWGWDITAYAWAFGDGATSDEAAPSHQFSEGGTFAVQLTVTGVDGAGTERSATGTLVVEVPRYALTIDVDQDLEHVELGFQWDLEATEILWDLGDGTNADTADPTHDYADLGVYEVTLRVADDQVVRTAAVTITVDNMRLAVDVVEGLPVNVFRATYTWLPDLSGVRTLWDYGDGTTSDGLEGFHSFAQEGTYQVRLTVSKGSTQATWLSDPIEVEIAEEPHVIVGIPDTGINPYHEMYYRPERTFPPDAYIPDFPELEALPLSVGPGKGTYAERLAADAAIWASVEEGTWYWIPQTVFIAVHCEEPYLVADDPSTTADESKFDQCILDDSHMHGTGTTSSALTENPDALIAFSESAGNVEQFVAAGIPVDVFSVSWGDGIGLPVVGGSVGLPVATPAPICESQRPVGSVYVTSSGNLPGWSTTLNCGSGHPDEISVGGAYAEDGSQELMAYKEPDVVSYYCRPTAQTQSLSDMRPSYCGTSFSAPTVAGALSKVILELRRESGYTGNMVLDATAEAYIDGSKTVSLQDLRDAMQETASYSPTAQYPNAGGVPVVPFAPWLQWGWGFYDGLVADDTISWLQGDRQPIKTGTERMYLEAIQAYKWAYFGGEPDPVVAWLMDVAEALAAAAGDLLP